MALTNPKIFGLEVLRNLADVKSSNLALRSLNLDIFDLDVIRGSQSEGGSETDWISFSRLEKPVYKEVTRFLDDSSVADNLLEDRAGTRTILFGNLYINGRLDGNAIRYRYIDGLGTNSRSSALADISTSRISSWSSSDSRATSTDAATQARANISYGAEVKISSGGELRFGTQTSGVTGDRIRTSLNAEEKRYDSEFPTHQIQIRVGNQTRQLYVMKGIPIIWTGFFRRLQPIAKFSSLIQNTSASWRIEQTSDPNRYSEWRNRGDTTSTFVFKQSSSKERYIKLYYNPDNISQITIQSANIAELPPVKFSGLTYLDYSNNDLKDFPSLAGTDGMAPNLTELRLKNNPFYYAENEDERKLNTTIINRIPTTVTQLYLGGTFGGTFDSDLIADRLPNLTTFNLDTGQGRRFERDNNAAVLPNIPNTVETYNVYNNKFESIDSSPSGSNKNVKTAENIIDLNLSYNRGLADSGFSIASDKIVTCNIAVTSLPIPDLRGKTTLVNFYSQWTQSSTLKNLHVGTEFKFANCSSLQRLYVYSSRISGAMPQFTGNDSLQYVDIRWNPIQGGSFDNSGNVDTSSDVLPEFTFQGAPNIRYFLWDSSSSLTTQINPNVLSSAPNLYYFRFTSHNRTAGNLPNVDTNTQLRYYMVYSNKITGNIPDFAACNNIYYIHLGYNELTGNIPGFSNRTNLYQLRLYNNQLTGIGTFENCTNLRYFWCHNNQIAGEIPDFSGCPRLYYLVMYNNQLTSYKKGAFTNLTQLRYLDVSRNSLNQTAINDIISDLYDNYNASPRSRMNVDIRGTNNSSPSGVALEYIEVLEGKGWDIRNN